MSKRLVAVVASAFVNIFRSGERMDIETLQQRMEAVRQEVAFLRDKISDPYARYELQVAVWKLEELDAVCFRCGPDTQTPYLDQADRMLAVAIDHVKSVRQAVFAAPEDTGS
jgi:hypothetical protein